MTGNEPSRTGGSTMEIAAPYVLYFGDIPDGTFAKTGLGLIEWRREQCIGQLRASGGVFASGLPEMTVEQAVAAGARSVIVGVAPPAGRIPHPWIDDLAAAAQSGLDLVSGMHVRLSDIDELREAAGASGAKLADVRIPPPDLPIGTGVKRSGLRLLTVGTDCSVGKKYTALAIEREMRKRGLPADFRATGQTGILIAGSGIPIDAVVADFIAGAAEVLSPSADADHWDIIEGQGALTNPSYAGVSLGLLHGSQPDALVLCHDPSREKHIGAAGAFPIVPVEEAMEIALMLARRVNPNARFVGISLNTSAVDPGSRDAIVQAFSERSRLPAFDPIIDGAGAVVDRIIQEDWGRVP